MRVDVVVDNSGSHPYFLVKCHGKERQIWETKRRFAAFRDFEEKTRHLKEGTITSPFPPTITSSAYGIKLTEKQLSERRSLLHKWLQDIVDNYHFLDTTTQQGLFRLLRGESASFQISAEDQSLSQQSFARSARNDPEPIPSAAESIQSDSTVKKLFRRGSSNIQSETKDKLSSEPNRQHSSSTGAVDKEGSNSPPPLRLVVRVSRGGAEGSHQTYETIISVENHVRPYIVTKIFKDYRQLAIDLRQEGVNVGSVDRESTTSADTRGIGEHELPVFPPTYATSKLGIPLDETEISHRCRRLDAWIRAVLIAYHKYSKEVQVLIERFLNINAVGEKMIHDDILHSLQRGSVADAVMVSTVTSVATPLPVPPEKSITETKVFDPSKPAATEAESDNLKEKDKPNRRGSVRDKMGKLASALSKKTLGSDEARGKSAAEKEIESAAEKEKAELEALRLQEDAFREAYSLRVTVSRGSPDDGHPTYDLKIKYSQSSAPHMILMKYFKDYRQLALDVNNKGITVPGVDSAGLGTDSRTPSTDTKSVGIKTEAAEGGANSTDGILPNFPRTYKRSSFGIAMPEADLQARCHALDQWTRALLSNYKLYDKEAQIVIDNFLRIDPEKTEPEFHQIIHHSLSKGYIIKPSALKPSAVLSLSSPAGTAPLSAEPKTTTGETPQQLLPGEQLAVGSSSKTVQTQAGPIVTGGKGDPDLDSTDDESEKYTEKNMTQEKSDIKKGTVDGMDAGLPPPLVAAGKAGGENEEWMEIQSEPNKKPAGCVPGCVLS